MRLRDKSLLTAGPLILILAMSTIGLMVFYQTYSLPQQLREKIEEDYLQNKKENLIGYIKLATNAIKHLHGPGLILTDEEAKEEAKKVLTNLKYSEEDGYFFVYDFSGTNIVHPVKEDWIDRNKWDYKDNTGKYVIRDLIKAAREGDGFDEYVFHKPSVIEDKGRPKLAYVIVLPDWNWVIGTGVYLDDVDSFLNGIDDKVKSHTDNAMIWIFLIACLSMLALSFAQRRIEKLIVLNDMAIELHKSVQQELVYIIREIGSQLEEARESTMAPENQILFVKLKKSARRALKWINDVQDGKDPSNPELIDGFNEVIENFKERERRIPVCFIPSNGAEIRLNNLSKTIKIALIETTREALTNAGKHAYATHIDIQLDYSGCSVILVIQDDGVGFEPDYVKKGIGINNIKQRIKKVGGTIHISTSPEGTTITVTTPLHYNIWNYLLCQMKHR